jgi:hypothetical protein
MFKFFDTGPSKASVTGAYVIWLLLENSLQRDIKIYLQT